jgi:hypothetical protein
VAVSGVGVGVRLRQRGRWRQNRPGAGVECGRRKVAAVVVGRGPYCWLSAG